jgi:hypothetical protein
MHVLARRVASSAFLVGLAFAVSSVSVVAQATQGKVEGHVRDAETGAPLAGAQITVVGTTLGNVANEDGYYFVNNVPAGVHDIRGQFIGYGTVTVTGQRVLAGQTATVDFALSTQAVQIEGITVEGETNPLVTRDQTLTKAVVTSEVLDAVPLDNVRAVVALQPGVVDTGSRLGQVIRGGRPGEAAVFIDGVLVRNFNSGAQSEITLQTNAVEEVDVLLGGFGAEFGQAQSGVINLVSRGGGTQFSGNLNFETDEISPGNSYGLNRLEASVSGPILGDALGFSLSGVAVGQKDARPTFLGDEIGTVTFANLGGITLPGQPDRFFAPTGETTTLSDGTELHEFQELGDLDGRLPWNNGDEYNLNLTLRGGTGAGTRYNAGLTLGRIQQRFFLPDMQFRPHGLLARRDDNYLLRGGLEHLLFQSSESSATLRVNVGYGRDEFTRGMLGETLDDTLSVINGSKYPMEGDFLGFTFEDFKFPFEDSYTVERWFARYDSIQENPSLGFLVPLETLINPETGEFFTIDEANTLFQFRGTGTDNPFGLQDYTGGGFYGYGNRVEETFSVRADLDWQYNRYNRLGFGGEVYWKDIENIGSGSAFGTAQSGVSNTSPTFQNVYTASPVIAGFYAKDRIDIGEIVLEIGGRVDMFDSDVMYPEIPGFAIPVNDPTQGLITPEFIQQETVWQFSPRLGVGFPVTENTQFRLSYGHFTQTPPLNFLFGGITNDLSKTNPNNIFGRPVDFGRTIGYEFGFTHSFDPQTVLDLSGYTREKQGDIAFRTGNISIPGQGEKTVRFLTNGDFGYIRGFDARVSRRWSELLFAQINYSYLTTRTTGSDPTQFLQTIGRQTNPVTGEAFTPPQAALPADFEQPHTFTGALVFTAPDDFLAERGALNTVLRNFTANVAFSARAGTPYTRTRTAGATSNILGPDPVFIEELNGSRLPWTYLLNVSVGRAVQLPNDMSVRGYIDVRNVANFKNTNTVFTRTGDELNPGANFLNNNTSGAPRVFDEDVDYADDDATLGGSPLSAIQREQFRRRDVFFGDGDGVLTVDEQELTSALSFLYSGWGNQVVTPPAQFFGQPRQIRFGIEWEF